MPKIIIKTPTSEYIIEDDSKLSKLLNVGDTDTSIPGLPIEPGMGSGHKLEGSVANEAPVISSSFKDKEIRFHSGKLAIVDAAILDAIEHPLEKDAIVIPVKSSEVTFLVSGTFDDAVLTGLTIEPKVLEDDDMEDGSLSDAEEGDVVVDPDTGEQEPEEKIKEAIKETVVTGHDNKYQRQKRAMEGSINQIRHNQGKEALSINKNSIPIPGKRKNGGVNDHVRTKAQKEQHSKISEAEVPASAGSRNFKLYDDSNDNELSNDSSEMAEQSVNESVESFLKKNVNKVLTEDKIRKVENRQKLADTLHIMMAMASAGWESDSGNLVHPLGVTISEGKWKCKDGCLIDEQGKRPSWDFEWAYNSREAVRSE